MVGIMINATSIVDDNSGIVGVGSMFGVVEEVTAGVKVGFVIVGEGVGLVLVVGVFVIANF
jgi:hypothetical protein